MADDISPVNLPPIASTGDAGPHDPRRGSNRRNKKNKNVEKSKDEGTGSNKLRTKRKIRIKTKMKTAAVQTLKAVKRNRHPPTSTSSASSMNWTASPDPHIPTKAQLFGLDSRPLIEEIGCAIAEAQAALFTGRIRDLESCILHQQQLCAELKMLQENAPLFKGDSRELVATAKLVRQQNQVVGAVVRRMRRHLNTLRNLLHGLSLTYQPKLVKAPDRNR